VASGWTFRGGWAVLVALAVTSVAWAQRPNAPARKNAPAPKSEQAERDFSQLPTFQVVRVLDANSLVVMVNGEMQTVRLIGVETPLAASGISKLARTRLSKESAQYLNTLLQGKAIYVEQEPGQPQMDDNGRALAYVYRAPDGLLVNQDMIAQGHGKASPQRNYSMFDAFQGEEQQAKAGKLGIWADPAAPEPETFLVLQGSKKYHRQGCRLVTKGATAITQADVKAKKLEPCLVCKPDQPVAAKAKAAAKTTTQQVRKKRQYQSQAEQRRLLDENVGPFIPAPGDGGGTLPY
jgi:micrococcal nuclease